jgi:hypothetical protein
VQAQKKDIGNWLIYVGNQKISEKFNWHNEVQYRNYNALGDVEQLLFRTGIGYNITPNNNNILMGYAFIHSQNYAANNVDKIKMDEHRIFQQFITKQVFDRCNIVHRYRIEERFINEDIKVRCRYFVGVNVPINKKMLDKNVWYLSMYNEIFVNINSPIFDRDRLYGAMGYCFNKFVKLEFGLMTQMQETTSRPQFQLAFYNNLPF